MATSQSEPDFESTIWKIWQDVHNRIDPLRQEAYKLLGHMSHGQTSKFSRLTSWLGVSSGRRGQSYSTRNTRAQNIMLPDQQPPKFDSRDKLTAFAHQGLRCARSYQEETQNISIPHPTDVLNITTKAGILLSYTEQISYRYRGFRKHPSRGNSLPSNLTGFWLSACMTIVATARDHITAADGHVKNLQEHMGFLERRRLAALLAVSFAFYVVFHPRQPLSFLGQVPIAIPLQYRLYWEILFWSLFGAISISFISVSEDVMSGNFDPRNVNKYEYRIAVAPFVAITLVLFVSLVGITSSGTTMKLSIAAPNYAVVVLLSFLFGFFSKRSLELLDQVWLRLFPGEQAGEPHQRKKGALSPR